MKPSNTAFDSGRSLLDLAGGLLSIVCLLHCLALPLALTLAPAFNVLLLEEGPFHRLLLILVLPASVLALSIGCRQHKQLGAVLLGALGLTLLTFTALAGHDAFGLTGERLATSAGALALALAHWQNFTACRQARCAHEHEHSNNENPSQ